jgi:predicted dehydrogenase
MGARTDERVRDTLPQGWLPLSHAEAIGSIDDLELVALCDTNEESLEWACQRYNVKAQFTDYKELIAQVKPDILTIATRTAGRCDIIEFAAENGVRGIHAEKPLSTNMADCKRALSAVEKNGVKLTYGTIRRFMEVYLKARDFVASGEIGDLVEICIEHGRTMLLWNHPHSVDLLIFFARCVEVDYLQASCAIKEGAIDGNLVDDDPILENAFVKFSNGINGVITSSAGLNIRLSGTTGTLVVMADGSWIEVHRKKDQRSPYNTLVQQIEIRPSTSGTQKVFQELTDALKVSGELSIRPEEIAISQSILLSFALSSILGGSKLAINELPTDFTVTGRFGSLYV